MSRIAIRKSLRLKTRDALTERSLDRLAPLMGLTPAERTILEFTALQANDSLLSEAMVQTLKPPAPTPPG